MNDFLKERIKELEDKISMLEQMPGRSNLTELRIGSAKRIRAFNVELLIFCNKKGES